MKNASNFLSKIYATFLIMVLLFGSPSLAISHPLVTSRRVIKINSFPRTPFFFVTHEKPKTREKKGRC